jgi:hypothetical protein
VARPTPELLRVKIDGADALIARMALLDANGHRRLMRGGLRAASRPLILRARALAPRGTRVRKDWKGRNTRPGELRRSIRFIARRDTTGGVQAEVRAGNARAWYAHIIERGAKAHEIRRGKRKRALNVDGLPRAGVKHPGVRGRFFMRDAAQQAARAASDAFAVYVRQRYDRVLATGKL